MSDDEGDDAPLGDLRDRLDVGESDESDSTVPVARPSTETDADRDAGTETEDDVDDAQFDEGSAAPLGDIAERVRERRSREDDEESPFESMSVGDVDSDAVWSELVEPETDTSEKHPGVGGPAEAVGGGEHIVEKASFCKRCPFVSEPPRLSCERDGTDILEVVDSKHFRVRNCPMVDDEDESPGGI